MNILKNMKTFRIEIIRVFLTVSLAALILFALAGCDSTPTEMEDYEREPILTAFLYNGEPVDEVLLERVASFYGYYDPSDPDNVISGAEVRLIQMDGPDAGDTLRFTENTPGVYLPDDPDTVKGMVHYRIEAHKPSENLFLWAETIVPDTFSLSINPLPVDTVEDVPILDTMNWNDPNIIINWTESNVYAGYVLNVICEDDSFIPLDPEYEFDEDEDSSRVSFDVALEGFNTNTLPWIHFRWQGWHKVELMAVDQGYFDYFMSVFRMQFGQVDALEYNVHGGLGIFAGMSHRSFRVYIERVE